ncbi:hypothetical protein C1645_695657, partial [Glomus cerebriforme]
TIYLPKLGPNKLQDRFHFSNEKLFLIRRNHHNQIYKSLIKALNEENTSRGLYIRGPSGLGKSYSLYYLVSELRLQPGYKVTYIDSCEEWWKSHQLEPYQYILNELLCTFNKDVLSPLTVTDWAEFVMHGPTTNIREKKERFVLFLKELANFVKIEYYWIWIFDQYNDLYKYNVLNEYPFVLVNVLSEMLKGAGLIIVSETSNNEISQFKTFKPWNKLQLFDGYNNEEYNQWCKFHGYENNAHLDTLKYWTGAYPLELNMWHKTLTSNLSNLQEITEKYLDEREDDITRNYQIYQENLSQKRIENLKKCITSMILQTDPPTNLCDMDRRFMHIGTVSFQDGDKEVKVKTVVANYPYIRLAIIHFYGYKIIDDLNVTTSAILQKDKYTNNVKERIVVSYITTTLDIVETFEFKCRKFSRPNLVVFDKSIRFDRVMRFFDNDIFLTNDLTEYNDLLFIPESSNYPGVDFLIWNRDDKVIFAFQITISELNDRKNIDNFMIKSDGLSLRSKWANLFGINESKIYLIWIVQDNIINKFIKKHSNRLYIPFSSIKNQFPAFNLDE